jgi:hypothetical protein
MDHELVACFKFGVGQHHIKADYSAKNSEKEREEGKVARER